MLKQVRTMEEFARLAGVSRPTASKYFENTAKVTARSKQKIDAALEKYDYRPNLHASNLMRKESKIIGVLIPSICDPFYAEIVRFMEIEALEHGFMLMIECSYDLQEMEEKALDNFMSLNVAGICIAPTGTTWSHKKKLSSLEKDCPVVFIDTPLDENSPYVKTDNQQSIGLITEYMIRTTDQPAFFPLPNVNCNMQQRTDAYIQTMKANNRIPLVLDVDINQVTLDFEKWGREQMLKLLEKGPLPRKSLICANDRIAFGVLSAAYASGLKVSGEEDADLAVAGHDNQPLSPFTCPSLTTVTQDVKCIGVTAVEILLEKMGKLDRGGLPDKVLIHAKLELRQSA